MQIIIPGRPYTKKNSQQLTRNKYTGKRGVIQSEAYRRYEESCLWELRKYKVKYTNAFNLCALYWMPSKQAWPDLIGLLQATSDILQKAGIIDDDRNIVSYDGSRIVGIDKDNPRVEITIREIGDHG